MCLLCGCGQRPSSTKTRIKTHLPLHLLLSKDERQRPSSTKTRIKTYALTHEIARSNLVRDHLPLQQGLRPQDTHRVSIYKHSGRQRPSSTTTRITYEKKRKRVEISENSFATAKTLLPFPLNKFSYISFIFAYFVNCIFRELCISLMQMSLF